MESFHLLAGTETGLFKGVNLSAKTWCNVNKPSGNDRRSVLKEQQISQLCWLDSSQQYAGLGLINHTVSVFDVAKSDFVKTHFLQSKDDDSPLVGLAGNRENFTTCSSSGNIRWWSTANEPECMVHLQAGPHIERMRPNKLSANVVATGGQKNDLKIWDMNNPQEPIFRAKNVRNDFLDLEVPVWVTDMAFLPDARRVVTCTNYHQVRLYDPKQQRRPVADIEWGEHPLKALTLHPNGYQVFVGNSCGDMALIDLRGKPYVMQKYKGGAGSIRSIECHGTEPLVASCGLDRYLRVHDINTKQLLHKYYLKSRLNCLLFTSLPLTLHNESVDDVSMTDETVARDEDADDNADKLWQQLEPVETSKKRKRKKTSTTGQKSLKSNKASD